MRRERLADAAVWALALLFLAPLAWVLAASLRAPGLPPPQGIEWFPQPVAWGNYARLFELLPFGRYLANSLLIAAVAVPLTLVTASWAGFAMARLDAVARRRLIILAAALMLVPQSAVWLPRFLMFRWLGLIDTPAALLAPAVMGSSPLLVLLCFWGFRRLPSELWDAAALDGAGVLTQWRRVALPAAGPTLLAVGVLAFLQYWGDFLSPLLYLKSPEGYTLPVGVQELLQLDRTNWPLLMAGCVLLTAPPALLFLAVQRLFLGETSLAGTRG
jgi:multiple sugar transport system permease protein